MKLKKCHIFTALCLFRVEEDMETKTRIQERNYEAGRDLITEETAATHRVKFSIYVYYAKSVGGPLSITGIVFYALFQVHLHKL